MRILALVAAAVAILGCSKDEKATGGAASASASAAASTPAPSASVASTPSAVASATPEPPHDCPAGSSGIGSFSKPCDAKGKERMMEVKWKKTDDKGPTFNVVSKSKLVILYGKMAVYFYDKSGKQIDTKEAIEGSEKTHAYHICSGSNIFGGVMKPGEAALLTMSCMKKSNIPDGTATIEAEMPVVGFADSTQKKNDFYWRNVELTPEDRPKGGIK